jgi:integrase/recombinase XerD
VDRGVSPITLNATITGLKFFFEVTLKRPELIAKMSHVRVARTLPVILSREEASRLIESASTLKHRTALSVAYGATFRCRKAKSKPRPEFGFEVANDGSVAYARMA